MESVLERPRKDIEIGNLVPLQERKVNFKSHHGFRKILSTIKAIGLLEPLCVYMENGKYSILDGYVRYKACEQLGVEVLPCTIYSVKEAYTFDRRVNHLSPIQEMRMLRKSVKILDESTIAEVFGMKSIKHRLGTAMLKQLHPRVIKILDNSLISRRVAEDFTRVTQERQIQILKEMQENNDYSSPFIRALIIKTPESQTINLELASESQRVLMKKSQDTTESRCAAKRACRE